MEARELRIGNLVEQGEYGIVSVSGYELYQLTVKENGGNCANYYHHWKPIPLTEEWLLKFGFEEYNNTNHYFINEFTICYINQKTGFRSVDFDCIDIKHVHQLQNLYFALTGEELQINHG